MAFSADGRQFAFSAGREARLWDLETGAQSGPGPSLKAWAIRSTSGPDRFCSAAARRRSGRGGPFGDYPPKDFPRVFVIRELTAREAARMLARIEDFSTGIYGGRLGRRDVPGSRGSAPSRGSRCGRSGSTTPRPGSGTGPIPSQQPVDPQGSNLDFDPTGNVLSAYLARGVVTLLDVAARRPLGELDPCRRPWGPGRSWLAGVAASRDHPAGFALFERGRKTPSDHLRRGLARTAAGPGSAPTAATSPGAIRTAR